MGARARARHARRSDAQKYAALKTRLDALAVDEQVLRFQLETLQKELGVTCASARLPPRALVPRLPPLTCASSA